MYNVTMQQEEQDDNESLMSLQPMLMLETRYRNGAQFSMEYAQKYLEQNSISYAKVQGIFYFENPIFSRLYNGVLGSEYREFDVENMVPFRYYWCGLWKDSYTSKDKIPKRVMGQIHEVLIVFETDGSKMVVDWNCGRISFTLIGFAQLFIPAGEGSVAPTAQPTLNRLRRFLGTSSPLLARSSPPTRNPQENINAYGT